MRRLFFSCLVLIVSVGTVWAQFGSIPNNSSEYRHEEMELTFYYPNDWFVGEAGGNLSIVNREELFEKAAMDLPDVQPGDVIMVIGIMPRFLMEMMGIPGDDISSILDGMYETVVSGNAGTLDNSSKEMLEYEGRRVASITFDDTSQEASGVFLVAHEQEEVIIFAAAYGFRESLDANRRLMGSIVASAEFTGDLESMMQQ